MNEQDIIKFMEDNSYKAITIDFQKDGVRVMKIWNHNSTDCKEITFDPRWNKMK